MKEHVGQCKVCGKDIDCLDGFLNGVVLADKTLVCFECDNGDEKNPSNP